MNLDTFNSNCHILMVQLKKQGGSSYLPKRVNKNENYKAMKMGVVLYFDFTFFKYFFQVQS